MKSLPLLLFVFLLYGCADMTGVTSTPATYHVYTLLNVGPPHGFSAKVVLTDLKGTEVAQTQTDSLGNATLSLAAGQYISKGIQNSLEFGTHTIRLQSGWDLYDSLIVCPNCR